MRRERRFAEPGPVRTSQGVPDAVQRPSRCAAEPGPIRISTHGPRISSASLRAAQHPGHVDKHPRSRRALRPRFANNFLTLRKEGTGNTGRSMHPQPRMQNKMSIRASSPRSHRFHPAFPAQWVTAYNGLSPVTGLFCHRRLRFLSQT